MGYAYYNEQLTHPPFAFSKVFAHLSADGLVDVLAECRVLCDPEENKSSVS